jgi:hypothetical protein
MSKRFTDSTKFRDPWYRKLSPKMKCLWEYILAECDLAGILEFDIDAIEFHIGENITIDDLKSLGNRIYFLEENKIFIPKFVQFQQGTLNPDNRAHKAIFSAFEKYNIPTDLNMDDFISPLDAPCKPLPRGQGIGNSKGIGNGIVNTREENFKKIDIDNDFEEFWKSYVPIEVHKGSKADAKKNYADALKKSSHDEIMNGLHNYMDYTQSSGCKTKQVARWLSKNGWLDDYHVQQSVNKKGKEDAMFNAWNEA